MFNRTIISEFFTTIDFKIFLKTLGLVTYKLPVLRTGGCVNKIENELVSYIGNEKSKIISFYNGRSAIFHCLKMIGVKRKDEVIISGYTCISVSNSVIQSGATPIYCDIEKKTLGLDIKSLKNLVTNNSKAIIVQHTFGKPSNIKDILKFANDNNILVIEDCAHSLSSRVDGQKLGSFGDFAIFSTGRDKVISSVTGGFLLINNKNYFGQVSKIINKLENVSIYETIKNLNYNLVAYKAYKTYDFFKLGRVIIFISRKLNLITEILTKSEKQCNYKDFNKKLPNSLAILASKELENIKIDSTHRRAIAEYYDEMLENKYIKPLFKLNDSEKNNYFRYPIIIKNNSIAQNIYKYMRKNNVILGNTWSNINIVPLGSNLLNALYKEGSCLNSEKLSGKILLLPNHRLTTSDDAKKVVELLNNYNKNV